MVKIVAEGGALEGDTLGGTSRDPLMCRGICEAPSGQRATLWVATFNVRATTTGGGPNVLVPTASNDPSAELLADKVMIYTLAKKSQVTTAVVPGSASHKTNQWHFGKRTAAVVTIPHQELVAAQAKRLTEDAG